MDIGMCARSRSRNPSSTRQSTCGRRSHSGRRRAHGSNPSLHASPACTIRECRSHASDNALEYLALFLGLDASLLLRLLQLALERSAHLSQLCIHLLARHLCRFTPRKDKPNKTYFLFIFFYLKSRNWTSCSVLQLSASTSLPSGYLLKLRRRYERIHHALLLN
jgi:hypothetical protein